MYVGNEPLCFGADEQQFCVLALKTEAVTLATSNAAVVFFPLIKCTSVSTICCQDTGQNKC